MIRTYGQFHSLDAFEIKAVLKSVVDFDNYNIFWNLSPEQMKLYQTDPKFKLSPEERAKIIDKLHKEYMQYKVTPEN